MIFRCEYYHYLFFYFNIIEYVIFFYSISLFQLGFEIAVAYNITYCFQKLQFFKKKHTFYFFIFIYLFFSNITPYFIQISKFLP